MPAERLPSPYAPSPSAPSPYAPRPAALVLTGSGSYRLTVLNVGLACCAVEAVVAALTQGGGTLPLTEPGTAVEVLVVSGTVTDKLAPLVRALYDGLPGPVRVLSFGACANSGGPYWDSYCVTKGVHLVIPVDAWVPGCPPRPEALLVALAGLTGHDGPQPGAPAVDGRSWSRDLQAPLCGPVAGPGDLRVPPVAP